MTIDNKYTELQEGCPFTLEEIAETSYIIVRFTNGTETTVQYGKIVSSNKTDMIVEEIGGNIYMFMKANMNSVYVSAPNES